MPETMKQKEIALRKSDGLKVLPIEFHLGYFAKDADGKVWYSFEHPDNPLWFSVDGMPADADSFGAKHGELAYAAWLAIVAYVEAAM